MYDARNGVRRVKDTLEGWPAINMENKRNRGESKGLWKSIFHYFGPQSRATGQTKSWIRRREKEILINREGKERKNF